MKEFSDCGGDKAHPLWRDSIKINIENLSNMFDDCSTDSLLDVGCGRGETISEVIKHCGKHFNLIVGVDVQRESLKYAKNKKIIPVQANLNYPLPFKDDSFDVIFSHQVIEHLDNLDIFVKNLYRILKPGGTLIISTENLSSWHNIFAIALGFQEFSNSPSKEFNVGNPFWKPWKQKFETRWGHKTIIAMKSLCGLLEVHGFVIKKVIGSGYYPFSGIFSKILAKLDKTHARHNMQSHQEIKNGGERKVKVLMIYTQFLPNVGGLEFQIYNIAKQLVKKGHMVEVCTSNIYQGSTNNLSPKDVIDGIMVERFWTMGGPLKRLYIAPGIVPKLLSDNSADQILFIYFLFCRISLRT